MCFYQGDYDWSVSETSQARIKSTGTKEFRCWDCRRIVPAGEECRWTEQWQFEQCPDCDKRHSDDDACSDIEKDVGEYSDFVQCQTCLDLRAGIKDLEMKEGCKEHEATPFYAIKDEFDNMQDPGRIREYVEHAAAMFPHQAEAIKARYGLFFEDEEEAVSA